MKFCMKCRAEFIDDCECCSDCGGPLLSIRKSESRMLNIMKHPVKLITLEETKEKELLKALLSQENITFYALEGEASWDRSENNAEDIYVEENRLEDASKTVDNFLGELADIKESRERKARMIKPVLLMTLGEEKGVRGWDLALFLEERKIQSYCETEKHYEASQHILSGGTMCGRMVFKENVFVDEMYLSEAVKAAEDFFEEHKYQEEWEILSGDTDEGVEEELEGEPVGEYGSMEYTDCEYIPDRFLKWLHRVLDRMK